MGDMRPIDQLLERAKTQGALADTCGVRYQAVQKWIKSGLVPPDRCPAIERAYGIQCEDLRPDVPWQRENGQIVGYTVQVGQESPPVTPDTA